MGAALEHFLAHRPQGEFTLVLGGSVEEDKPEPDDVELLDRLKEAIAAGSSASDAARQLAAETGLSRRKLYGLIHQDTAD